MMGRADSRSEVGSPTCGLAIDQCRPHELSAVTQVFPDIALPHGYDGPTCGFQSSSSCSISNLVHGNLSLPIACIRGRLQISPLRTPDTTVPKAAVHKH